jgi:hypothetical protein
MSNPLEKQERGLNWSLPRGGASALPEVLAPDERSKPGNIERKQRNSEAAGSRQGTAGDMAVDLLGDMGEIGVGLGAVSSRTRSGTRRDERNQGRRILIF